MNIIMTNAVDKGVIIDKNAFLWWESVHFYILYLGFVYESGGAISEKTARFLKPYDGMRNGM